MESSAKNLRPQSRRGGVRVVGKVRPFLDSEIAGGPIRSDVTVSRTEGDHAVVDFGDRTSGGNKRDSYKLDWCYEQNEGVGDVFVREVKPFLEGLFRGCNGCVIAYGARGSEKSQLIQGSDEIPGLAFISVSEILSLADEYGGSVAMSCYEVSQDHIYDILEPKEQEVLVLEDAARRIQLRGLSKVPINSIADFKKLYYNYGNQKAPLQNINDSVIGNHRGLMIFVSCVDKESNKSFVGKMNFVDLTGFEDAKQKINSKAHAIECNKINKSLYALLNVVNALNANENFIPYRESKLTRLLQDCLCRTSRAVFITCLNPILCQDTIHAISLACRSSQVINQYRMDSAKIIKNGSRFIPSCSPSTVGLRTSETSLKKLKPSKFGSTEKKGNETPSILKMKTKPQFSSTKKSGIAKCGTIEKSTDDSSAVAKGRKLFHGTSPVSKYLKTNIRSSEITAVASVDMNNAKLGSTNAECSDLEKGNNLYVDPITKDSLIAKMDDCCINKVTDVQDSDINLEIDEKISSDQCDRTKDETYSYVSNEDVQSPPISEKLREISNALKLLSTQTCPGTPKIDASCTKHTNREVLDPRTPGVSFEMRLDGASHVDYMCTPQDTFKTRSTGLKKSLLQECLTFLNTASKEELKGLKGIGEKRANYIVDLREKSPQPFKDINDLKTLGLTSKQINTMMSGILGEF